MSKSPWRTYVYRVCDQCAEPGHSASVCAREHVHQFTTTGLSLPPACRCGKGRADA